MHFLKIPYAEKTDRNKGYGVFELKLKHLEKIEELNLPHN
jgi:hypothetical protein